MSNPVADRVYESSLTSGDVLTFTLAGPVPGGYRSYSEAIAAGDLAASFIACISEPAANQYLWGLCSLDVTGTLLTVNTIGGTSNNDTNPLSWTGTTLLILNEWPAADLVYLTPAGPSIPLGVGTYATLAAAQAALIPPYLQQVTLLGYSAAFDGGGAPYTRAMAAPGHPGYFRDASGAYFVIAAALPTPKMLGAAGNAVQDPVTRAITGTDDTIACQNWALVCRAQVKAMYLGPYKYFVHGFQTVRTAWSNQKLYGDDPAVSGFMNVSTNLAIWTNRGTISAPTAFGVWLTAPAVSGARTVSVNSVAGLSAEMWASLADQSNSFYSNEPSGANPATACSKIGEKVQIESFTQTGGATNTGTITFTKALHFSYASNATGTLSTNLAPLTAPTVNNSLENFAIHNDPNLAYVNTTHQISETNSIGFRSYRVHFIDRLTYGYSFGDAIDWEVDHTHTEGGWGVFSYFIVNDQGTWNGRFINSTGNGARHFITSSASGNTPTGPCLVMGNTLDGAYLSAIDQHPNAWGWQIIGNNIRGGGTDGVTFGNGIDMRGKDSWAIGNDISDCGGFGVGSNYGSGNHSRSNKISNCGTPYFVFTGDNFDSDGDILIVGPLTTSLVWLDNCYNAKAITNVNNGVVAGGIYPRMAFRFKVTGNPSTAAVLVTGHVGALSDGWIFEIRGPDVTNWQSGTGFSPGQIFNSLTPFPLDNTNKLTAGWGLNSYPTNVVAGALTPNPLNGLDQTTFNQGAFTLHPPTIDCVMTLRVVNENAGPITFAGWGYDGATAVYSSAGTKRFIFRITVNSGDSMIEAFYMAGT